MKKQYIFVLLMLLLLYIPISDVSAQQITYKGTTVPYNADYPYYVTFNVPFSGGKNMLYTSKAPLYISKYPNSWEPQYNNYVILASDEANVFANNEDNRHYDDMVNDVRLDYAHTNGYLYAFTIRAQGAYNDYSGTLQYTSHNLYDNNGIMIYSKSQSLDSYEYSSTLIETPKNLRSKLLLPTGLFPKERESKIQLTWTPPLNQYNVEISLMYSYRSGTDKITKTLPYVVHIQNYMSNLGTHTSLMQTDIESFIHLKNASTVGQTFANGKLNLTHYYVRYTRYDENKDKVLYGNWVKVDLVTGKSEIDKGKVVSGYDEVYEDEDGNEIKVPNSEYDGNLYDNDGNKIDPTSLTSFTEYLLAIPNILGSTFTSLMSLVTGMGSFGAVISAVFVGMPPIMVAMITGGLGLMIILGIIKFLK